MAGYVGEIENTEAQTDDSAMRLVKLYEIGVFMPFILYLAFKEKPVTRNESRFLLANAGVLGLVNAVVVLKRM